MPGRDGTGPMTQGPMTGGGFGRCASGWRRPWSGGGSSRSSGGFGAGFGWHRHRWAPWSQGWRRAAELDEVMSPWSLEAGRDGLRREVRHLERELKHLRAHLAELDAEAAD